MKLPDIIELAKFSITNNKRLLLVGAPGVGKTDAIKQACQQEKVRLIIEHPAIADPTDYKGAIYAKDWKASFIPFDFLNTLITTTSKTVVLLDDLGQAPFSVQAAIMQLIYGGEICGHQISQEVVFMGATNRREDRAGVVGLIEPVKRRFDTIINVDVDVDGWVGWALSKDMPAELIAFIQFRPDLLLSGTPSSDIVNTASPATVAAIGYMMMDGLPKQYRFETFKGAAGEGFAREFMAFLKIVDNLPDILLILSNPMGTAIPSDPSVLFALINAIGARVTPNTLTNAFVFFGRLPKEMETAGVVNMVRRHKWAAKSFEFKNWCIKNSNVLI